jgi:tRNA-Thr(GGU) m(6)t(6)A37 methyltransferase TsaA
MPPITFIPIGVVHSPYKAPEATPIQSLYAEGSKGTAEIYPEFAEGLRDLGDFSHLHLFYFFHLIGEKRLVVTPFLDDVPHGVFATRAPCRPNPIGVSLVRLVGVRGNILDLEDVDVVSGTPLLDIKPHIPDFDCRRDVRCGWYDKVDRSFARIRGRRAGDLGEAGMGMNHEAN